MFAHSKGPNQLKHNLNQTYDYWSGKHKWQLDRIAQDAFPEARIFTDTIQDTRIKLDANLGVAILWKDYCSECSAVSGYGPQCLEVTFKGEDGNVDHLDHVCLVETSNCVYKGSFINEVEATPVVATRGCPGQYAGITEVSFKCQSVNALLFVSDANGGTTQPELPTEGQVIDIVVRESSLTRQFLNSKYFLLPRQDVNFPDNGFVMDVVIIYDDSYRDTLHSGSDAAAIAQINAVMAHVQTFFNLKVRKKP